jgi:tetratricopeptide (TPR) repeat protein
MKKVSIFVLALAFSLNVFSARTARAQGLDLSQYGVRVEPDKRLIVVLASLEAAGMETPLTARGAEFRQKLQADFEGLDKELVEKMKFFIKQYKSRHAGESDAQMLAPFVSMAYALTPVPDLAEPSRSATDLPGNLLEVLDFSPLVREFYRRSTLNAKLDEYFKDYQAAGDGLRPSARQMVSQLLDYLHTKPQLTYAEKIKVQAKDAKNKKIEKTEIRERTRRFFIIPELLASKGTINFVNTGDDYFAIVPPGTDLGASEVRRAYLQFVLDPLIFDNAKDISGFREGIKALLDERRKTNPNISPDVFLAVSRSLVAAVDAKQDEFEKTRLATSQARQKIDLMKTVEEKKAVSAELERLKTSFADETALELSEAYEKGAVLAFYFAKHLKGLEDSGFDIASSMRDIILSLDTTKEANRLTEFADARNRAVKVREDRKRNPQTQSAIIENPVTVKLTDINKIIDGRNYAAAETQLKKLLAEYPTESARIYYALGRLSSLSAEGLPKEELDKRNQRLLEAKAAYTNVIRSATANTDPALLSLSYVALGRIYEFYDDADYAIKIYETAIKFGDVTGGAYKEAVAAKERLSKKQ